MDLSADAPIEVDLSLVKHENCMTHDVTRCPHCSYFSKSQFLMRNHELRHTSNIKTFSCETSIIEPFVCGRCEFTTHLQRCYNEHVEKIHLRKEKALTNFNLKFYTCVNCSFKTFSYLIWLKHKCESCENEESLKKTAPRSYCQESYRLFKCDKCDYKTKWKNYLKRHISNRHVRDDEIEWCTCKVCDYKTKRKENLKRHVTTQHMEYVNWFSCSLCKFKSKELVGLRRHIKNKHEGRHFQCDRCDYSSKSLLRIERHAFKRHETKWYHCDQCEYKSKKSENLKRHYNSQHLADEYARWFRCNQCDFSTKHQGGVRKHIKYSHEPKTEAEKRFHCTKCNYSAKTMARMTLHGISKHGEPRKNGDPRWFVCEMCGYKTNKAANLKRHINSQHLPDECAKWVQCNQCEFRSKHSDNVIKHIRNIHDKSR